jgi:hypothetical protein
LKSLDFQATTTTQIDFNGLCLLQSTLERIDMRDCNVDMPVEGLEGLLNECANLREFSYRSPLFTDAHLDCFAKYGRSIELLHIQNCPSITLEGMVRLLQSRVIARISRIVANENSFEDEESRAKLALVTPKHMYLDVVHGANYPPHHNHVATPQV